MKAAPPAGRVLLSIALGLPACAREAARDVAPSVPPTPSPIPTPHEGAFTAAVDALAAEALERGPIAGLSIAVARGARMVTAKGYGYADREAGIEATASTSYPIASVSKLFTAAAILRLAERGKLGLDDPLGRFFPGSKKAIEALTLKQLLNHTSGLTRGGPAPRQAAESVLRRGGTAWAAGDEWDYSNYNFSLLGLVVERASGRTYAEYVREELAGPLGLAGTGYCEDGTMLPGRGRDYASGRKTVSPTPYWTEPRFFAAGGLCSTVLDLVAWERALDEGRVLSPASVSAMRAPTAVRGGLEVEYGLGTRLGMTAGRRKLGHTGGGRSNKAVLARYPDDDVTIAVLLNTEATGQPVVATDLEAHIARLLFGVPEPGPEGVAVAAEELRRYAGRYSDGGRLVRVAVEGGTLKLGAGPRSSSSLVAHGGDVFANASEPAREMRFRVGEGAASGYARYHNGWFVGRGVRIGDLPPAAAGGGNAPGGKAPRRDAARRPR